MMKILLFIFLYTALQITADEIPQSPERCLQNSIIYFDRADLEETRDMWLQSAAPGIAYPSEIERENTLSEMKKRLIKWQWKKIRNEISLPEIYLLLSEIENKNMDYLYLAEDGKPAFDENGKPLFRGLANLESDLLSWEGELRNFIEKLFTDWESRAKVQYDGLISSDKSIDSSETALLDTSFSEYRDCIRREFEYLYLAGRKSLITRRSLDSFSMKKESEDKSASIEAEKRIEEVSLSLKNASDSLKHNLLLMQDLSSEDAGIKINEWEDDFREEFEKGLRKWENSEKDFLTERMRWELDGKNSYIEAEKEWDSAIEKFTSARGNWSLEMNEIIEEGRRYWEEREQKFFETYKDAAAGVECASLKEKIRFEKEITGYLSVYRESRNIEAMADENAGYLNNEIKRIENYKAEKQRTVDRINSGISEIEGDISAYRKSIVNAHKEQEEWLREHRHPKSTLQWRISICTRKIDELEKLLPSLYTDRSIAEEIRDRKNDELSSYRAELVFWEKSQIDYRNARIEAEDALLSLEERINTGVYGGDEFDSELGILKDKRDILEKKLEASLHVYEYSLDNTSGRERKADTESKYREALSFFKEKETIYSDKIKELDDFIENILGGNEKEIEDKKKELLEAEEKFEEARCEYESAMEIFRLKDSGLIETAISNLEDENDNYINNDIESIWTDYFLHMEKQLRNEREWAAEEILSDIKGDSDADNIMDISVLEERYNFLDILSPDYSVSDISDLKNKFALKGFENDNLLINKFFLSLENSNAEEGGFLLNLLKIKYRTELEEVRQGMDILSLEVSGKSADDLTSEAESVLEEKKTELFGDNYEAEDVISFLSDILFEDLPFDAADPEVIKKIYSIALLESRIRGINKYSIYSPAFTLDERKALYEELSDLFCLVNDCVSSGAGFTPSIYTEDDLIDFYEKLSGMENVPVYVEEITAKLLEMIIKDRGFIFNDLPLYETELASYIDRIESYSAYDPLTLSELEEKKDEITVRIETIRDLNEYCIQSFKKDYTNSERRVYENLLVKALSIMKSDISVLTSPEIVKNKSSLIAGSEAEHESCNIKLSDLKEQLDEWENKQSEYFDKNIADKKDALERYRTETASLRIEYHTLLNHFTLLTDEYRIKKKAADEALNAFTDSKWNLYKAEELKDYACSPYRLENTDPDTILKFRQAEFEKADSLYNEVLNIKSSLSRKAVDDRFDSEYLQTLDEKNSLISSVNYIGKAAGSLARNIASAEEEAGRYYSVMGDSIGSIFSFNLPFKPDAENYEGQLTDFTGLSTEAEIETAVDNYFSQKDAGQVFSNDALRWAKCILDSGYDGGNSLLRKFGIAFYAEYREKVSVAIYSDQNYLQLKKSSYADCSPEKYADSYALNILSEIKNNDGLNILYSFFKAMHLTGNTSFDPSFMGKDISRIAHDYLWDESKSEEHHIRKKHWWSNFWKRTASKMRKMRHNMTDVNGNYERNMIWDDIEKTFTARAGFLSKRDEIKILTGGVEGKTAAFDDFIISLETAAGEFPAETGAGFDEFLRSIYDSSSEEEKATSYTLAVKTFDYLNIMLGEKEDQLYLITERLEKERENLLTEYRVKMNSPESGPDEVKDFFTSLFYNSSYSEREAAEISLSEILSTSSDDLKGRERTLSYYSNELLKLFSSSVDIRINENDIRMKNQYFEILDKKELFAKRTAELYETGVYEWGNSFTELLGRRKKWRDDFQKEVLLKEDLWREKYNIFRENRNRWIEESALSASRGEAGRLAREVGINADSLLAESGAIIIPDIKNTPSLDGLVEKVTDSRKLSNLISSASYYSSGKESDKTALSSYLPAIGSFGCNDITIESFADKLSADIRKRASLLEALKMAKTVSEIENGIADNIEEANRSTDKALSDTLEGKGYRRKGDIFSRKAVIDMTLFGGIEEEVHEIGAYNYFTSPDFETGADLSRESLSSMSYREIELKVEKAVTDLKRYSELIFGSMTSEDTYGWKGFDEVFKSYVKTMERKFSSSAQSRRYKDTKGLFYMHLGYAPVMDSKSPEEVGTEGYGEYGRIYKLFLRNEARLGRGLASFDIPWYSQKMWDDDKDNDGKSDGVLGAPIVRSAGNIAMSVLSGGAGAWAFAVSMIDDAAFTAMDIGSGITDWDKGLMSLGKQAGTSFVSGKIGEAYKKAENHSFFSSTAAAGIKTASVNLSASAVNSFSLNSGGLYFSSSRFEKNWQSDLYGKRALSGYISSMGSAGLDSSLTGFYGKDLAYGKSLSSLTAGAAAGVYEYNALGSTKLNMLNSSDLFFS